MIKRILSFVVFIFLLSSCVSQADVLENADKLVEKGKFAIATEILKESLNSTNDSELKETIRWEIERINRIRRDYSETREVMLKSLGRRIVDFKDEELDQWEEKGLFDVRIIDGTKYYQFPSVSNLFYRNYDIKIRKKGYRKESNEDNDHWADYEKLMAIKKEVKDSICSPRICEITMTVTVDADVVSHGSVIRAWIPYPKQYKTQSGIKLLDSIPEEVEINKPEQPMRAVYMEKPAIEGEPTKFQIHYNLICYANVTEVDPDNVLPYNENDPLVKYYLSEKAPHVLFLPEIVDLAKEIVGNETNPYLKAKKIYRWIGKNIKYSYAHEYSTMKNISKFVCNRRYGDCGQEALLFITLCRASGVMARWQSGWTLYDEWTGIHDWTEIYIEPYGWLPVDPYMGIHFTSMSEALESDKLEKLADFYFGNMDQYRLIANLEHGYPLYPPKDDFRSDTVDFQRGEVEANGKNIYYGNFSYKLRVKEIDPCK